MDFLYGAKSTVNDVKTAAVVAIILAIVATLLMLVFVLPERKRKQLTSAFRVIHDFYNLKSFWLEGIAKFIFVLCSTFCVFMGIALIFSKHVSFGTSLALIVLGPIASRIIYEGIMIIIILVRNTMDIRNYLMGVKVEKPEQVNAEEVMGNVMTKIKRAVVVEEDEPEVCVNICKYCGHLLEDDALFCENCGKPVED